MKETNVTKETGGQGWLKGRTLAQALFLYEEHYFDLKATAEANFHPNCQWVKIFLHDQPGVLLHRSLESYENFEGNMKEFTKAVIDGSLS